MLTIDKSSAYVSLLIQIPHIAVLGLCILCSETAHQQAHSGSLHGQPWAVYAPQKTGHHRSAADEGSGSGREESQEDGEVRVTSCCQRNYTAVCDSWCLKPFSKFKEIAQYCKCTKHVITSLLLTNMTWFKNIMQQEGQVCSLWQRLWKFELYPALCVLAVWLQGSVN